MTDQPHTPGDGELYEHAPCGLVCTRENGMIERVNRTFCDWLGYEPAQLVGQRRIQDLFTMGGKIFHQTHWQPLLQMQGSVAEIYLDLVHREGSTIPALFNARRCQVAGEARHELAVFQATDRRKYEQELMVARRRAEELLERERVAQGELARVLREQEQVARQRAELAEQLVGIVSHDLRNPLNAISLGVQVVSAGETQHARTLSRIGAAAGRATRLIGDLLDLTQSRLAGGLRVVPALIDVEELIQHAVEELRLAWPGRTLAASHRGARTVSVDGDRVTQVITNLATNALSYGEPGRAVTITSAVEEACATLEVHNFGPPIPPSLMPHLFEPMRRGEQHTQSGGRSVGLGLYIVQAIALAHGGSVDVQSSEHEGTRFRVRLPRQVVTPRG